MFPTFKPLFLITTLLLVSTTVFSQVVAQEEVGEQGDTIITAENINYIKYWGKDTISVSLEEPQAWAKDLKIELITKELYDRKKATAVQYLLSDTVEHRKQNQTITLPCKTKTVFLVDKTEEEESGEEYTYIGQIPILNSYVIMGLFYEDFAYFLIDKTTGERTTYFGEFPFISPNKKHIVYLCFNPYDVNSEVGIYSLKNKKISQIINLSFSNWVPDEKENIFWSNDGYLYFPANHPSKYWLPNGNVNTKWQYLRLSCKL